MIYITRHGETDWNKEHRIQGHMDIPLNNQGRLDAKRAKEKLKGIKFDVVFSSPLSRALETAKIITKHKIIIDDRLIERGNSKLEGISDEELFKTINWDDEENPYGIEKLSDLRKRVYSFLDEIVSNYKGKNVLIVSHAGIGIQIRTYFEGELKKDEDINIYRLRNGEVLEYDNSK